MKAIFGGSSEVSKKVDAACSETLLGPDWGLNLDVCDLVNASDSGPKECVKAIKKKLKSDKFKVIELALTLLETGVKNCGIRFHAVVADDEFMEEIVKLTNGKKGPAITDRALNLIQSWGETFERQRTNPQLAGFHKTYQMLRSRGARFPAKEAESLQSAQTAQAVQGSTIQRAPPPAPAPARYGAGPQSQSFTGIPQESDNYPVQGYRSRPAGPPVTSPLNPYDPPVVRPPPPPAAARSSGYPIAAPGRQPALGATKGIDKAKVAEELVSARENVNLLWEILNANDPVKENIGENELATQLLETCREVQNRVQQLITEIQDSSQPDLDTLMFELLQVNDELIRVFEAHEHHRTGTYSTPPPAVAQPAARPAPAVAPNPAREIENGMKNMSVNQPAQAAAKPQVDEDDLQELALRSRAKSKAAAAAAATPAVAAAAPAQYGAPTPTEATAYENYQQDPNAYANYNQYQDPNAYQAQQGEYQQYDASAYPDQSYNYSQDPNTYQQGQGYAADGTYQQEGQQYTAEEQAAWAANQEAWNQYYAQQAQYAADPNAAYTDPNHAAGGHTEAAQANHAVPASTWS